MGTKLSLRLGLGVVLEEADPEEVVDVGAEDEFIGEEDEGGSMFMSRICLACAFSDTFIDDRPLGPTAQLNDISGRPSRTS
jgi:hypothetical protein